MTRYNNARSILIGYLMTAVFCLAIACLLWIIGAADEFSQAILVSMSIGISCMTAFVVVEPLLLEKLSELWAASITSLVGLFVGLLIAGYLITSNPWHFFSAEQATLALGVFFSVLGCIVFSTQARVSQLSAELSHIQATEAAAAQKLAETELRLLQAQIEPHFLFNTLSNVTSMIHSNPLGAEQTLNNLSTLLRNSLRQTREPLTDLGEELRVLRAYLDIQKIRMGERLQYQIDAPAELNGTPIPPLLLQPLVENAIGHGIEPSIEGGRVDVTVEQLGNKVKITVQDTGIGIANSSPNKGTGLSNVLERLRALYQAQASLKLSQNSPQGVIVELELPLELPSVSQPSIQGAKS